MIGRAWYEEVVGRGNFSVDSDKLVLGPFILRLIQLHGLRLGQRHDSSPDTVLGGPSKQVDTKRA